ncbi:hypothetical protein P175DRAFT_0128191 [Aspergillus ochraceoroseus IBT 24754]|uniref:Uncharacterized protein n=1 Tax=Aspergillus ochraceoroseus IBT 24754 TaxID=1392256 RepID=A0A2T5M187_9EURO|nr:uncharacterized protein P175DRAFT_0128191 [Aspergillus ochraceoroseus IBT 24754]PTU22295.1 hypothetical protein P175DRAFT_0128191 [Aspergillus ochraceoroseus IBT 24754]
MGQRYEMARMAGDTMTVEIGATAILIFGLGQPDAIGCDIFASGIAIAFVSSCGAIIRNLRPLLAAENNVAALESLNLQLNTVLGYWQDNRELFSDMTRLIVLVVSVGVPVDMPDWVGWIRGRLSTFGIQKPIISYEIPVADTTGVQSSLFVDARLGIPWIYIEGTPHPFKIYMGV